VDARDAFDLALGGEAFVEALVLERLDLRRPGRQPALPALLAPSTGSASTCARSAQTRSIALIVTGLVTM
jgi:hypothetical protein